MPVSLSFCMIVKNEEQHLPECLGSIGDLAGELIVIDTGSTDRTASIATGYRAQVIPFDFSLADFSAARNHAIDHARGRWILMLDADETLDRRSKTAIEEFIEFDENAGYYLERHNQAAAGQAPFTDFVVRLFPNLPQYRFRGRVHETIDASILAAGGKLRRTGIRIDHKFSLDPDARRHKNRRYIEILKEEIAADPLDDSRLYFLAAEYHQLQKFDEATRVAERVARIKPADPSAHLFAGIYHLLYQSDSPRARTDFQQVLRLRPDDAEAQTFLRLIDQRERLAA